MDNKAKISCENSNINVLDHFIDVNKMLQIWSGAERKQQDYKLTRYACYSIALEIVEKNVVDYIL